MIHIKVCEFFQLLTLLTRGLVGPEASCAFQGSTPGPQGLAFGPLQMRASGLGTKRTSGAHHVAYSWVGGFE